MWLRLLQPSSLLLRPILLPWPFKQPKSAPRLSQPFGPTIELVAFSPYFFTDLTFPNSSLAPGVNRLSTIHIGTFLPSFSNPNGEQHLSRQVIELTSALPQQTTLVNRLLQRTEIQRASYASYALAEKQALWDEAKQSNKNESEHMERFPTREDSASETFTKFTVPIG